MDEKILGREGPKAPGSQAIVRRVEGCVRGGGWAPALLARLSESFTEAARLGEQHAERRPAAPHFARRSRCTALHPAGRHHSQCFHVGSLQNFEKKCRFHDTYIKY